MRKPPEEPPYPLDWTEGFESEVEILLGLERGAEALLGLEHVLQRDPQNQGTAVPDTDIRVVQIELREGQFSVFYKVDDRGQVTLLSLQPVDLADLG